MIDHRDQYQIGACVVYVPEGVITKISGYLWCQAVGSSPKIMGYELDCGITAQASDLRYFTPADGL